MFVLLSGMTFQSGVTAVGSNVHLALTYIVAIVLVLCVGCFVGILAVEVLRSVQFARHLRRKRKQPLSSRNLPVNLAGDTVTEEGDQGTDR